MLSFQGGFRAAAYAASKGGVAQLTKALANEWARARSQRQRDRPGLREDAAEPAHLAGRPGAERGRPRSPAGGTVGRAGRPRGRGRLSRIRRVRLRPWHRAAGGWWLACPIAETAAAVAGGLRVLVTGAAGGLGQALVAEADHRGATGSRRRAAARHRRRGASSGCDPGGGRPPPPDDCRSLVHEAASTRWARHRRQQRCHADADAVPGSSSTTWTRLEGEPPRPGADHAGELRLSPQRRNPPSSTSSRPRV